MAYINTNIAKASSRRPTLSRLTALYDVWRQRRVLKRLSDEQLQDIGISRRQANAEAIRPIWDVPHHWR